MYMQAISVIILQLQWAWTACIMYYKLLTNIIHVNKEINKQIN